MQPLPSRHSRRWKTARYRKKSWPAARLVHHHHYASHALFYLALFTAETVLLGYVLWSGPHIWPTWSIASIVLANMFFALIAGNHHVSKASKQIAADILLAALSMLTLVVLTILVAFSANGPAILAYAWLCALLVNTLHYYPGRSWKARRRH